MKPKYVDAPKLWCTPTGYVDNSMYFKGEYIGVDGCGERLGIMCSCANWRCELKGVYRKDLYKELRADG